MEEPLDIGFYIATPYPGTPLYELVKEKGWLKVTDFDKYDTATPIFETPYLKTEKLMEIRYKAHQRFYLRPTHVIRMFGKGRIYGISTLKTSLVEVSMLNVSDTLIAVLLGAPKTVESTISFEN